MEIPDAYQEYIAARREDAEIDKIGTVMLPASELAAIWSLIAASVDGQKEELSVASKGRWESILRTIARAVQEAQ